MSQHAPNADNLETFCRIDWFAKSAFHAELSALLAHVRTHPDVTLTPPGDAPPSTAETAFLAGLIKHVIKTERAATVMGQVDRWHDAAHDVHGRRANVMHPTSDPTADRILRSVFRDGER